MKRLPSGNILLGVNIGDSIPGGRQIFEINEAGDIQPNRYF